MDGIYAWWDADVSKWRWDFSMGGTEIHIAEPSLEAFSDKVKQLLEPLGPSFYPIPIHLAAGPYSN